MRVGGGKSKSLERKTEASSTASNIPGGCAAGESSFGERERASFIKHAVRREVPGATTAILSLQSLQSCHCSYHGGGAHQETSAGEEDRRWVERVEESSSDEEEAVARERKEEPHDACERRARR